MTVLGLIRRMNAGDGRPPYSFVDVCHTHKCRATHMGKRGGPCDCGGAEMEAKLISILERINVPKKIEAELV